MTSTNSATVRVGRASGETGTDRPPPSGRDLDTAAARLLPRRHPAQWISALIALVLMAMFVHTLITNKNFQWPVVWQYFGARDVLKGLFLTVWLTIAVMVCGYLLGIGVAAMRLSGNHVF